MGGGESMANDFFLAPKQWSFCLQKCTKLETTKVLSPKEAPGNFMCACCNSDFSYLCQKDLNEHRQMCYAKFGMMAEPVNLERQKGVPSRILFPKKVIKVSPLNFVCEFCNNDFSYLSRKDLKLHRQMCETSFNMMVEPEMCTQSMVIKEEIDEWKH